MTTATCHGKYKVFWFDKHITKWWDLLQPLKGTPAQCLEIGSFEGRSSMWLLDNILTHPDARLTCVDPYNYAVNLMGHMATVASDFDIERIYERFLSNTETARNEGRLTHVRSPSHVALRKYPAKSMDLVYVDGSHYASDVFIDIALSWLLVKPGGLLLLDDYDWAHEKRKTKVYLARPRVAIEAFLHIFDEQYELLDKDKQVVVRRNIVPGEG